METEANIFSTNIIRSQKELNNNLNDLFKNIPATPIDAFVKKDEHHVFCHKTEKYYISQNNSQLKVMTVEKIRELFEEDVYSYLPAEINNQQNLLLQKIREGSTNEYSTRELAKNIRNSDNPISRSTWQMLSNINPEQHLCNKQLVLWNGKYIVVNGSRGGEKKFACEYDLSNYKLYKKRSQTSNVFYKRNELLKKSLCIKFKPGPLRRKQDLDVSHQKYHIGKIKVVNIPKGGLDVYPSYGVGLESNVTKIINSCRDVDGVISEKWAEFAVSMLGVVKEHHIIQANTNSCITFDLAYKNEQKKILMRQNDDYIFKTVSLKEVLSFDQIQEVNMAEIEGIINKMLDTVELSLNQDQIYSKDELLNTIKEPTVNKLSVNAKDKQKRKYYELDRLDVTVIRIPENCLNGENRMCSQEYCRLGCICASLECKHITNKHCSRIECVFQCQCNFVDYKHGNLITNRCSEIMPGLLNVDTEVNSKLAKEEKKFHQTVVVSGEKSILLQSLKRNSKAPKKYGDFYKNVNFKSHIDRNRALSIVILKFDAKNIESWCMVHKLYKCFCKGKFKRNYVGGATNSGEVPFDNVEDPNSSDDSINTSCLGSRTRYQRRSNNKLCQNDENIIEIDPDNNVEGSIPSSCARRMPYTGRKFNNDYYKVTNNKIFEMERNDKKIQKRMKVILMSGDHSEEPHVSNDIPCKEPEPVMKSTNTKPVERNNSTMPLNSMLNKANFATWLEANYKLYKTRNERGRLLLSAPKPGRLALYPWSFLLQRYKERKNMFLVTKQKPYRIFMAISIKDEVLEDCIFIDEIRFGDLSKFPLTVRNLLTNVTNLENIFYILYGLQSSWELIGSVTKISEPFHANTSPNIDHKSIPSQSIPINDIFVANTISEMQSGETTNADRPLTSPSPFVSINDTFEGKNIRALQLSSSNNNTPTKKSRNTLLNNSESSKWFIMNIENDFTEIQFQSRGFFVKYGSILKAINVARKTGKTVRLSTQTCASKSNSPQFGVYAIPDSKGQYVFVGPYEVHEHLGIETIKTIPKTPRLTHGIWITTNKLDNMKVIDNPLSFMSQNNIDNNVMVPIDIESTSKYEDIDLSKSNDTSNEAPNPSPSKKLIKPITIRKTNGFYHLASNGVLKKISLPDSKKVRNPLQNNLNTENQNELNTSDSTLSTLTNESDKQNPNGVSSLDSHTTHSDKEKGEMVVLKPEEINKRVCCSNLNINNENDPSSVQNDTNKTSPNDSPIDTDIENFLSTPLPCTKEDWDTFVISDDSDCNTEENISEVKKVGDVCIKCSNINNLGWIKGKRNVNELLSFEFPGFRPSEFYHEEEAFNKINQVLARKIYIPKHINPKWEVIDLNKRLYKKDLLDVKYLNSKYIMTEQGLQHIMNSVNNRKANFKNKRNTRNRSRNFSQKSPERTMQPNSTCSSDEPSAIIQDLEDTSARLEGVGIKLWNEALANKDNILTSLTSVTEEVKDEMTETLKSIAMMSE